MTNYINAEAFAEHIKMLIDSDRAKHDYFYNLAAELKAEDKGMTQLREALEQEFDDKTDEVTDQYLSDVLSKVYSNSEFYYELCLLIWDDERVGEIINE